MEYADDQTVYDGMWKDNVVDGDGILDEENTRLFAEFFKGKKVSLFLESD